MKKACMKCKNVNNDYIWEEKYEVPEDTDVEIYLSDTIQWFNSTLRPNESLRKIVEIWEEAMEDGSVPNRPHVWEKTNLVTQSGKGRLYDTYKCTSCGITGKRFGLNGNVTRDNKYKAMKYLFCHN